MDRNYKRRHVFLEFITNSLGFTKPNQQNIKMKLTLVLILLNAFATIDAFRPKRSRFMRFHRHNDAAKDEQASIQRKQKLVELISNAKSKDTLNALMNALASKTTEQNKQNIRYTLYNISLI